MIPKIIKEALRPIKNLILPPDTPYTQKMVQKYCTGFGLEVGPGARSYTSLDSTIYLDKYPTLEKTHTRKFLIADALTIPVKTNTFDFILSAHCLEHCPDTIKVLREWIRISKPGGKLFIVLPHGERTFDRGRELTSLEHHISDYENRVDHLDKTHWGEFEQYSIPQFDHLWKPEAQNEDGSWNFPWIVQNGHLHYHVWTEVELENLLRYLGMEIIFSTPEVPDRTDSFLVVAQVN